MLFTKSIFAPKSSADGIRISVMSRHTLNDGKTPDPRITRDSYSEWWHEFAPPDRLVGGFYKRGLPWADFEKAYLAHLRTPTNSLLVSEIARRAALKDLTLMCAEETPERCHRRLLAEECQRLNKELVVIIR